MRKTVTDRWQHYLVLLRRATIGMRVTVKTKQLLQDGGAPEYVYHDRTAWRCAVFVGKRYGSKRISTKKCCPCTLNIACHVKQPSKTTSFGGTLSDDELVDRAVCTWFRQQPKEFYAAGFQGIVKRWGKCLTLRRLMSYIYIYGAPILDVSRSHTTTQHSR